MWLLAFVLASSAFADSAASVPLSFSVAGFSSNPDLVNINSGTIRVDGAWIALQETKVWPRNSCKQSSALPVTTRPMVADLVAVEKPAMLTLPSGNYCSFNVAISPATERTRELRRASIVIKGRRSDGVSFEIRSRVDLRGILRSAALEGFTIQSPGTSWILGVDLGVWLTGVNLDDAEPGRDPRTILIDETSNPERLAELEKNVASGFGLFLDANKDGKLDPAERATSLASQR